MASKYYVVWQGRQTGIFDSWPRCKAQVDGFAGAKFKSFATLSAAELAFSGAVTTAVTDNIGKKTNKSSSLSQLEVDQKAFDVKIFTDGACEPNPGEAGTGLAVYQHNKLSALWYGLYRAVGTNNTAELQGLYQALLLAKAQLTAGHSVAIFCDSKYAIDCTTKWAAGWEKKGWTKSGTDIKNLDLIKPLHILYQALLANIKIYHVKGHAGIEGNELADRMSILAIDQKEESLRLFSQAHNIPAILAKRRG